MYCKQCGKQISDDSIYCRHCGCRQSEVISSESEGDLNSTFSNGLDKNHLKSLLSNKLGWLIGYGIYVIINVLFLVGGDTSSTAKEDFWPFGDPHFLGHEPFNLNDYDITEFLVYVLLIPLVLGWFWHIPKKDKQSIE